MKRPAPSAEPAADEALVAMLRTIGEREITERLDSQILGRCLGWTPAQTSDSIVAAKARLLIWAIRVGSNPGPCFEDIELTVQGRRFLTAAQT